MRKGLNYIGELASKIYFTIPIIHLLVKRIVNLIKQTTWEVSLIRKQRHKAAVNNFRIGIKMLKAGHLHDAMLRFWLVSKFHKKSGTNNYYIAYLHYRFGNIDKAIRYLYISYSKQPERYKRCQCLLRKMLSVYHVQFNRVARYQQHNPDANAEFIMGSKQTITSNLSKTNEDASNS